MKSSANNIAPTNESDAIKDNGLNSGNKWQEAAFVDEMKERLASFNNGKAKTYSWAEVQAEAQAALATKKQKSTYF